MKNKLISTLLALTTLTSLAQEPNNAELFIHLKKVKGDIQAKLQELENDKMQIKAELDDNEYQKIEDVFEDLITLAEPYISSTQAEIKDAYFDTIYNQMKSIHSVENMWKQQMDKEFIIRGWNSNYENHAQHHENIKSIWTKHFKNDSMINFGTKKIFKIVDEKRTLSTVLKKIEDDTSDLVQKSGKTELLKQLKVKKRALEKSKTYKSAAEKVLEWWYQDDFSFPAQLYHAIYYQPKNAKPLSPSSPEFNQAYFRPRPRKIVSKSFFGIVTETEGPIRFMDYDASYQKDFEKHHQEYCEKNPQGRWKDLTYDDFYVRTPTLFWLAHMIIYKKNNAIDDLKEINPLIAELEAQA